MGPTEGGQSVKPAARLLIGLLCASLAVSCVQFQRWQKRQVQALRAIELEDVAKSWCQTIRASQVIPVYPLTEDVQPGDVFLVTTTIEKQHEQYNGNGFLPLDYHLVRLDPKGYADFYSHSVQPGDPRPPPPLLPADWMRPPGWTPEVEKAWAAAPRAAFPSYSFSVKAGAGFNLALPVQGVPVGLSLLGAQAASGTISIGDARTIGVDILSLWRDLEAWALEQAEPLAAYATRGGDPSYLRVITRVYLTGSLDVSLSSSASAAAGADVGAPSPLSLLTADPPEEGQAEQATVKSYKEALDRLNETLDPQPSPEGEGEPPPTERGKTASLRVTAATAGTVSLHEKLDPPLVLGYLGFDCEILPGGRLGNPIPTLVTLSEPQLAQRLFRSSRTARIQSDSLRARLVALLRELSGSDELPADLRAQGEQALASVDALGTWAKDETPVYIETAVEDPLTIERSSFGAEVAERELDGYTRFTEYVALMEVSRSVLENALERGGIVVVHPDGVEEPLDPSTEGGTAQVLRDDLARITALLEEAAWDQDRERAVRKADRWLASLLAY